MGVCLGFMVEDSPSRSVEQVEEYVEKETDKRGRLSLGSALADQRVRAIVQHALDLDELEVVYARHQLGLSNEGKRALMADQRFGIDWDVGPVTHRSFYERIDSQAALKDINKMHEIRNNGALAFVEYDLSHLGGTWAGTHSEGEEPEIALLGYVAPGTPIRSIKYDATKNPPADAVATEHPESYRYIKSLPLMGVVEATPEDAPDLFDARRPRGSVRGWPSQADAVRSLYRNLR